MKQKELRKFAVCHLCKKKIGESGIPVFYRVKVEQYLLDIKAINRQAGLEMMFGSPTLAMHMGPDEDLARNMGGKKLSVCMSCATEKMVCVAEFLDAETNEEEE